MLVTNVIDEQVPGKFLVMLPATYSVTSHFPLSDFLPRDGKHRPSFVFLRKLDLLGKHVLLLHPHSYSLLCTIDCDVIIIARCRRSLIVRRPPLACDQVSGNVAEKRGSGIGKRARSFITLHYSVPEPGFSENFPVKKK